MFYALHYSTWSCQREVKDPSGAWLLRIGIIDSPLPEGFLPCKSSRDRDEH